MDRLPPARAATRTVEQLLSAHDLRAAIIDILAATPLDEQALRDAVWTYVRGEREVGVAPGVVILALTEMVEAASVVRKEIGLQRTHQVILWCVEAYFGHLGGDALGRDRESMAHAPSHDASSGTSS